MWWKVYCSGCNDKYIVHDSLDVELTCMRVGCFKKLKKIKQIEKSEVDHELAISKLGYRSIIEELENKIEELTKELDSYKRE
jgi:hypothetical protein